MQREIEKYLIKWKEDTSRLPIILRGARQVGKSFTVEKFGQNHFENNITANFESHPELSLCFETLDPIAICAKFEIAFRTRIIPGKTLLFLDEIQNCPRAIVALRYFKEMLPALHVIAAGSLLEFTLHEEQFSFPVGRVQFLYLKPLSFWEFLKSQKNGPLLNWLENISLGEVTDSFIHQQLLTSLREYFMIGGMPYVVQRYLETRSFLECQAALENLLEAYRIDFPKYSTKAQYKNLQLFFEKAPGLISQNFKYSHISSEKRSNELKIALEQLQWAGLLHRVISTSGSGLPFNVHAKENKFKLLFLDIGLVNSANRLDFQSAWEEELLQINAGRQAEQFVGQELLAYSDAHTNPQLYYWERDQKNSMAEVDFLAQLGKHIIPLEVKAGTTGSLKSLSLFLDEKKEPFGVRFSLHPLSFHDRVLSIPLYLMSQHTRLMRQALDYI